MTAIKKKMEQRKGSGGRGSVWAHVMRVQKRLVKT